MKVEVCHAESGMMTRATVALADGGTVADAIVASGLADPASLADPSFACAVFGRRAVATTVLADGDRVELLRPLRVDPMEARRRRTLKKREAAAVTDVSAAASHGSPRPG